MILLRSSPHDNGVFIFYDKAKKQIIKSSSDRLAIRRIKNEFTGSKWYLGRIKSELKNGFQIERWLNDSYIRLTIPFIDGQIVPYHRSISINEGHIQKVFAYYSSIWPVQKRVPIHGDFSLGNIIWQKNEIHIIDWEHFAPNAAPWGFDLMNMLYESLFFSMKGDQISPADLSAFLRLRRDLTQRLPKHGFSSDLESLLVHMQTNRHYWGQAIKKLPIMNFSRSQIAKIKSLN